MNKPGFQTLAGLLSWVVLLPATHADLLFYEGFDYPRGDELGDTVATSARWENDKSQFKVGSGSLNYSGLEASSGNHLNVSSTSPSMDSVRTISGAWPAQTNGTVYVSFLLRIESAEGIGAAGEGTSVLTISKASNNTQLLGINLLNTDGLKLGVLKFPSSSTPVSSAFFSSGTGSDLSTNGSATYLVVAKYEWVDGEDNDVVTLWVNPSTLGGDEDPANKVSTCAGSDGTQAAGRLTLSRGPEITIDEIRIAQKWAEVTRAPAPGSSAATHAVPVQPEAFAASQFDDSSPPVPDVTNINRSANQITGKP